LVFDAGLAETKWAKRIAFYELKLAQKYQQSKTLMS
jgi:hypothetical protein